MVEDTHGRRVKNRREQTHAGKRIDRVLARRAATGEERLEGLRGELHDMVVLDPTHPAALERVPSGMEHAEPHYDITWDITW